MDIDQYQTKLIELWESTSEDPLLFFAVGMAEESGEALGKVKRLMRGDGFDREGYLIELGDVLAYLTMAASLMRIDLQYTNNNFVKSTLIRETIFLAERSSTVPYLIETVEDFKEDVDFAERSFNSVYSSLMDCAHEANSTLEEVMQMNIDKLTDRKSRNVLRGSGDNR